MSNEIFRAESQETSLESRLSIEMSNEIFRAESAEDSLAAALSASGTNLSADLSVEISRATEKETSLESRLSVEMSNEIFRAESAETSLSSRVSVEESKSSKVENRLQISPIVYTVLVGNGENTEINVQHDINTLDVIVQIYEAASPYATVDAGIERVDANNINLIFNEAPANNEYKVIVMGVTGFNY